VTREVSETEEAVASTLDRMASRHPGHAGRLRDMSQAAREHAALERRRLQDYLGSQAGNGGAG
jgi:hypothetical protein